MAHWQHVIFSGESRVQLYPVDGRLRVRRLPGKSFQQRCQAYWVQAAGGSVHVWGASHGGAKSPRVLPDRYLTGELYRGILWNTLVPFARQHFGDNYRYQDDNATPHRARVVLDFLQQRNISKMEQPARSPNCNPIKHIWGELGRVITSMDTSMDKWAEIHVERLQPLVVSVPRHLVAIIAATGGNSPFRELATRGTSTNQIAASWMLQAMWLATVASRHIVWQALLISL